MSMTISITPTFVAILKRLSNAQRCQAARSVQLQAFTFYFQTEHHNFAQQQLSYYIFTDLTNKIIHLYLQFKLEYFPNWYCLQDLFGRPLGYWNCSTVLFWNSYYFHLSDIPLRLINKNLIIYYISVGSINIHIFGISNLIIYYISDSVGSINIHILV